MGHNGLGKTQGINLGLLQECTRSFHGLRCDLKKLILKARFFLLRSSEQLS